MDTLSIGQGSRRAGVGVETVRLPPLARRSPSAICEREELWVHRKSTRMGSLPDVSVMFSHLLSKLLCILFV